MNINKKISKVMLSASILLSFAGTAFAATQYPDGGVWTYGAANGGAYSNYYHGSKYHSSSVVSLKDSDSDKGYANAGATSYAWISTTFGEKVAFYYNYY